MRTIAIANLKGGTGKTTTCHALGAALAGEYGRSVLLVDCDPQASLTAACGVQVAASRSLAGLFDKSFDSSVELELLMYHIIHKVSPRVDVVPAHIALARSEQRLVSSKDLSILRKALATVAFRYYVALLDCPAELGPLMSTALEAADAVLIPTVPNIVDLRALKLFLEALQDFRRRVNPRLEILGILITFFDSRTTHHQRIVHAMRGLALPVLDVMIGRSIAVAEAPNESKSIVEYARGHSQALAYRELAAIVDRWISARTHVPS